MMNTVQLFAMPTRLFAFFVAHTAMHGYGKRQLKGPSPTCQPLRDVIVNDFPLVNTALLQREFLLALKMLNMANEFLMPRQRYEF